MISRRQLLASAAAVVAAPLLPPPPSAAATIGADLAAGPDLMAFAVGTPGEFDWQVFRASSAEEAWRMWFRQEVGDPEGEIVDLDGVQRVPLWDAIEHVQPADWIGAGLGHCCERCGYETHPEVGARVIAGEVVCEECLTVADRAVDDSAGLIEDLANEIADEGEAEVRARIETAGHWDLVAADIWPRAVAMAGEG